MHSKNSMASPTPIVDGDRLYVHFGHMGTAALDLAGNVDLAAIVTRVSSAAWQRRVAHLVRRSLIFSCDGNEDPFVAALDRVTGDVHWKQPRNTTADQDFLLFHANRNRSRGAEAGHQRRQRFCRRLRSGRRPRNLARPLRRRILGCAAARIRERPAVRRIRLRSVDSVRHRSEGRRGDATETNVVWTLDKGAPLTPSVLVMGDELYFVSDNGVATCIDATHQEKSLDQTPWRRLLGVAHARRWPHLLPKRSWRDDGRESRH